MRKNWIQVCWVALMAMLMWGTAMGQDPKPENLQAAYDAETGKVTLSWDYQPHNWFDGAESYESFAVEDFGDWVLSEPRYKYNVFIRVKSDYPQEAARFEGEQGWIIFDYGKVENRPGKTSVDFYQPRTGSLQFLCQSIECGVNGDAMADYMIRPVSKGGGKLRFWAYGIGATTTETSSGMGEKLVVLYSNTTAEVSALKPIQTLYVPRSYNEYTVNIPEDAKYVAFCYEVDLYDGNTPQENSKGVSLDDIDYYVGEPYRAVSSFKVYKDDVEVEGLSLDRNSRSCTFDLTPGSYTLGVSAVYANDASESEKASLSFELLENPPVENTSISVAGNDVTVKWGKPSQGNPVSYDVSLLDEQGQETGSSVAGITQTSHTFNDLSAGTYKASIVANYTGDAKSQAVETKEVTVAAVANSEMVVTISSNTGVLVQDLLHVVMEGNQTYDEPVLAEVEAGKVTATFSEIPTGSYKLKVSLKYHADVEQDVVLSEAEEVASVEMKENVSPVSTLIAQRTGVDVDLMWSIQPATWYDNAESYDAFEYQAMEGWTLSSPVAKRASHDGVTWTNMEQPQSWAVFTPGEVNGIGKINLDWSKVGRNCFISMAKTSGAASDYMIHQVVGGGVLKFKVAGTSSTACNYSIKYTTVQGQVDIASFTLIPGASADVANNWKEVVVAVPTDAKAIAICNTSSGITMGSLLIDDITYTLATIEAMPKEIQVVVDAAEPVIRPATDTTYKVENLPAGEHTIKVQAVYASEASPVAKTVTVDIPDLAAPQDLVVTPSSESRTALLAWTPVEDALRYALYLDGKVVTDTVLSNQYLFQGLTVGKHTVGVQAIYAGNEVSAISNSSEFEIESVIVEEPALVTFNVSTPGAVVRNTRIVLSTDEEDEAYVGTFSGILGYGNTGKIDIEDVELGVYTMTATLDKHRTIIVEDLRIGKDTTVKVAFVENVALAKITSADSVAPASYRIRWELEPEVSGESVEAKNYAVYLDGSKVETLGNTVLEYTFENLSVGEHTLAVAAVQYAGETRKDSRTVTVRESEEPDPDPEPSDSAVYPQPVNLKVEVAGDSAVFTFAAGDSVPEHYTIYLDGEKVAEEVKETRYVFTQLKDGKYTAGVVAVYKDSVSAMASLGFEVSNGGGTGVEQGGLVQMKLYPNPSNSAQVNVILPSSGKLSVANLQGRVVYTKEIPAQGLYTLQLPSLTSGLYMVRFEGQGGMKTIKWVIR